MFENSLGSRHFGTYFGIRHTVNHYNLRRRTFLLHRSAGIGSPVRNLLLGAAALVAGAVNSLGAPPENDTYTSPEALVGSEPSTSGNNAEATQGVYERQNDYNGVWFRWTPDASGGYEITTKGSAFDTLLEVFWVNRNFDGDIVGYDALRGNDNAFGAAPGTVTSTVNMNLFAGVEYGFLLASKVKGQGGAYQLKVTKIAPPPNDSPSGAVQLTGTSPSITGETAGATSGDGAFWKNGVWYRWEAPTSELYRISTTGSQFSPTLSSPFLEVYTGTPGNFEEVVPPTDDNVALNAAVGTTYWIVVSTLSAANSGFLRLLIARPPPNDTAATASPIPPAGGSVEGSNFGASGSSSFFGLYHDLWYRWQPAEEATYTLSTVGSSIETGIVAYTGEDAENRTRVALEYSKLDPSTGLRTTKMELPVLPTNIYWIRVASTEEGLTGTLKLTISKLGETPTASGNIDLSVIYERGFFDRETGIWVSKPNFILLWNAPNPATEFTIESSKTMEAWTPLSNVSIRVSNGRANATMPGNPRLLRQFHYRVRSQ